MYSLQSKLFVHEDYVLHPNAPARLEAFEKAMGQTARRFSDKDIPALIAERGWDKLRSKKYGEQPGIVDTDVVLMLGRWEANPNWESVSEACPNGAARGIASFMMGRQTFSWFQSGHNTWTEPRRDHVCRPAWRLATMNGCNHKCAYCGLSGVHMSMLNLEEYAEHLKMLIDNNPWEKTYLFNDCSDTLVVEPEADNIRFFIDFFKQIPDRYFIVHTKSANVDHLLDYDHDKRAIMLWTVTGPTAARVYEPGAPSTAERLEAARKCYQAGYPVRIKFKPIIPVVNWREEATQMAEMLLNGMRPEVINILSLAWMDVHTMKRAFKEIDLDPEAIAAAEAAEEQMKGNRLAPFPHEFRAKIYDHFITEIRKIDKEVPITFSTESLDMWREFGPRLGYNASDYICGCGAQATPGLKRLPCSPWASCKPVTWDGKVMIPPEKKKD